MEIKLKNITKKYFGDSFSVLENINLEIAKKEFLVILGPAKCGKSTLLRIIAGLNTITSGELYFGSNQVNHLDLSQRNLAMIFPSSSPYLHLTIYKDQAFIIKFFKNKRSINDVTKGCFFNIQKISESFKKTKIKKDQKFSKLSSKILKKPKLFLIDEPLANLNQKTSEKLRKHFINIHREINTTIIYATENALEAMAMATKIVIINQAKVQQIGSPLTLYKKPSNIFVAKYLGYATFNLWAGKVIGNSFVSFSNLINCNLSKKYLKFLQNKNITEISLGIRGEHLKIVTSKKDCNFRAKISTIEFLGKEHQIRGLISGKEKFVATIFNSQSFLQKDSTKKAKILNFKFNTKDAFFFNTKNGQTIWP